MIHRAESTICNDWRSLLYKAGGLGGAVSSLAGPGQSAVGDPAGEAPRSSEKFAFYNTKEEKNHLCGAFFQCFEYSLKNLSDTIDSLI